MFGKYGEIYLVDFTKFSSLCHLPHSQSAEHTPDRTGELAPTERVSEAC